MITDDDIENLANLARISVTDEEKHALAKDLEAILAYVSDIKEPASAVGVDEKKIGILKNVMREDGPSHEKGIYTEAILREVPQKEGGYVKVKKILS